MPFNPGLPDITAPFLGESVLLAGFVFFLRGVEGLRIGMIREERYVLHKIIE